MHPLCCLLEFIVCPTFLHINLACWSSHSAQAHSVWQIRVCSFTFPRASFARFFFVFFVLGPQSNLVEWGPHHPSSQQESLPAGSGSDSCMFFFKSWINEFAVGFIIRACLCQVFYNGSNRLRPAVPEVWKWVLYTNFIYIKSILHCKIGKCEHIQYNHHSLWEKAGAGYSKRYVDNYLISQLIETNAWAKKS